MKRRRTADQEQEALLMATSSDIDLKLIEAMSGHVIARGSWSATLRANCLYHSAHLAKPGRRCRLLQGTRKITPLAALVLSLGTCIQVCLAFHSCCQQILTL
ncbi:unnamed protein product [Polarella glacialis]|uniref:Uncharacterized protein n=1 Tax=Polarella glacialis TaxID=89957 RepID=A0A813I5A6_POLGL|nr:unnamed protein product [Polarella glacialis]